MFIHQPIREVAVTKETTVKLLNSSQRIKFFLKHTDVCVSQNDRLQKELNNKEKELELKRTESAQFKAKREYRHYISKRLKFAMFSMPATFCSLSQ